MRFATLIIALLFLAACASKVTTSSTTGSGKYSEDLSGLRKMEPIPADTSKVTGTGNTDMKRNPAIYLEPRHAVNQSLDVVLDSIDRIHLANGVVDGYTIQLYSGVQRDEALDVRKQVATVLASDRCRHAVCATQLPGARRKIYEPSRSTKGLYDGEKIFSQRHYNPRPDCDQMTVKTFRISLLRLMKFR
jgi:hypothetical protein